MNVSFPYAYTAKSLRLDFENTAIVYALHGQKSTGLVMRSLLVAINRAEKRGKPVSLHTMTFTVGSIGENWHFDFHPRYGSRVVKRISAGRST